jgi:hypothetical protein
MLTSSLPAQAPARLRLQRRSAASGRVSCASAKPSAKPAAGCAAAAPRLSAGGAGLTGLAAASPLLLVAQVRLAQCHSLSAALCCLLRPAAVARVSEDPTPRSPLS